MPLVDNESLQGYDNIIIGPEQEWNDKIEQWLYPWLDRGGRAIVLERKPGNIEIFKIGSNPFFSGYTIECAIPWKSIEEAGINQKDCKASVYIIDIDRPHKEEARLIYPMDKEAKIRFIFE